jgi:exonuclease SbcC
VDGAEVEAAQEAEKKARLAWEKSDRALLACRGEIKNLQQRLEEWQQALGEWADRPLSEFKAASQSWEKQVAQLKQQVGQQPEKEIAQQQLKAQIDQLGQEQEQLQEQMAELQTWKATADARLAEYAGRLPESWRDAKALKQQIQSLEGQIKSRITAEKQAREQSQQVATELARQTALLKEWESEKKKLLKRVEQLKQVWQVALAESGLQSLESFTQAQLEAKQLQQMEQSIQEYDQQCIVVRTAVSELQTELKGRQEPDLSQLDATCHTLGTQLKAAEGVESEWRGKWRQLEELEQKLAAVTLEMEALDKQYALYGTLYKVAAGQEGQRVSLQRFVLGVLLDDVLAEATRRLAIMSRGRYQLLRRQGTLDNRSASGLDLEVEDAHTGKTRPVATLSGGESFMAALALALGLSDVVQSYSGGIRLDMLFIDEGFGSLDPESLELAIRTLIDLQASGRMIGIISHVSELKEQMALRLDVKSSRTGSRVVMVAP